MVWYGNDVVINYLVRIAFRFISDWLRKRREGFFFTQSQSVVIYFRYSSEIFSELVQEITFVVDEKQKRQEKQQQTETVANIHITCLKIDYPDTLNRCYAIVAKK